MDGATANLQPWPLSMSNSASLDYPPEDVDISLQLLLKLMFVGLRGYAGDVSLPYFEKCNSLNSVVAPPQAPPLLKLVFGGLRGYAGDVSPPAALDLVSTRGNTFIIDLRSSR